MNIPAHLTHFVQVIIDSYFIIDLEHNIIDFNRTFHSMLPRSVARNLKTKKCYEVLQLDICKENCIAKQCWANNIHVRFDEINGQIAEENEKLRFILSAIPIRNEQGQIIGAMEVQRNVTDEALVQVKYQRQMDDSTLKQKNLQDELQNRTRRLLEVSRRLYKVQQDLIKTKSDLF